MMEEYAAKLCEKLIVNDDFFVLYKIIIIQYFFNYQINISIEKNKRKFTKVEK